MFTQENLDKIDRLKKLYPTSKALTLPALWIAQEQFGWISPQTMKYIAGLLDLPLHHVYGVATFYTMFNTKPVGKYHLQICRNVSCQLMSSEKITDYICKKLAIKVGETNSDGRFTLSEVECLGSCGTAPMMQVNDDYFEHLTTDKVDKLLDELR
jgi:NADH-quinone oxidoreductase E subunit